MLPANDFGYPLELLSKARAAMPASAFVGLFAVATVHLTEDEIRALADRLVAPSAE